MMMRAVIALTIFAALAQSPADTGEAWARVAALYTRRVQEVGIVGSSLVFVANGKVTHQETLLRGFGRIRHVVNAPDGTLLVVFDTPGLIVRLVPAP